MLYEFQPIDGDHNWYTVFHELRLLEESARRAGMLFPLVLLHDVEWPYARRDMYYEPSRIPDAFRHPFASSGMRPGQSPLTPDGFLPHRFNATEEGTARNGVLTAVEDFVAQSDVRLHFQIVPWLHGLGILLPADRMEASAELRAFLASLLPAEPLASHLRRVDALRVDGQMSRDETERTRFSPEKMSLAHEAKIDLFRRENEELRLSRLALQMSVGRVAASERQYKEEVEWMRGSLSWRLTAPLRGLLARLRSLRRR